MNENIESCEEGEGGYMSINGSYMSINGSHDRMLCGGNDKYNVILYPLSDEHLPNYINGIPTRRCCTGQKGKRE